MTFKIMNKGKSPHDFDIPELRKGTKYIAPGKATTLTVDSVGGYYAFAPARKRRRAALQVVS